MLPRVARRLRGAGWLLLAALCGPAGAAEFDAGGELRSGLDLRRTNDRGPLVAADAISPDLAPVDGSGLRAEAELRGQWHPAATRPWLSALNANLLLAAERPEGGPTRSRARFNELNVASDLGAWQLSAGKKIVGWDVGYGFRPNDVVQQEQRRSLLTLTPEGRPLLQVEHFGTDLASALVWVNPHHAGDADDAQRGAGESALAARVYVRRGAADWHAFARWGEHTRASVGAALAWVATDELELHASLRTLQRHDGWRIDSPATGSPVAANPWTQATLGRTSQALLGASWTGALQQSVLLEWWHDGTTLSDAQWDDWSQRNRALAALGATQGLPVALRNGIAGNLVWQASPFGDTQNLRRENLFVRLAWQPDHWVVSLDALVHPADGGRAVTLGVQWQGDRLRLNAAWRTYGGGDALLAQLPQRRVGLLAAAWSF